MKLLFALLLSIFYTHSLPLNAPAGKLNSKPVVTITDSPLDDDKFPPPPENVGRLFYMHRTSNSNTLIYELNTKNGQLDQDNPMHVYWIRNAESGQKEELNYIQRKFAYGLITKKLNNDEYDVRFVSYKKFPLRLMKANDGKYHIFANFEQKQMILNRIFIKIEGGSFWLPNIIYVELRGTEPLTGREIIQRFKP
jgi:hypothetical protein